MKSRFEDLLHKNEEFADFRVNPNSRTWWKPIVEDTLVAYDKLCPTKEYLVEDPLTRVARIAKRNLMLVAPILFLISLYGFNSEGPKLLSFGLATKSQFVVIGALYVVVIYLAISYLLHYFRDILRLFHAKSGLIHEFFVYPLFLTNNYVISQRRAIEQEGSIESRIENTNKVNEFISLLVANYAKIKILTSFSYLRFFLEIVIWDLFVPMLLTFLALYSSFGYFSLFLNDIFIKLGS